MRKAFETLKRYRKTPIGPEQKEYIAWIVSGWIGDKVDSRDLTQDMYVWLGSYTDSDASRMVTSMGEAQSMETHRLMFEQATPASTNQIMKKRAKVMAPIAARVVEDVPKQIAAWKGIRR